MTEIPEVDDENYDKQNALDSSAELNTTDNTVHSKSVMETIEPSCSFDIFQDNNVDTNVTVVIGDEEDEEELDVKVDCELDNNNIVELDDGFLWVSSTINEDATYQLPTCPEKTTSATLATSPSDRIVKDKHIENTGGCEWVSNTTNDDATCQIPTCLENKTNTHLTTFKPSDRTVKEKHFENTAGSDQIKESDKVVLTCGNGGEGDTIPDTCLNRLRVDDSGKCCLSRSKLGSLKLNSKYVPVANKRKSDGNESVQALKNPFDKCKVYKVVNIEIPKQDFLLKAPERFRDTEDMPKFNENNVTGICSSVPLSPSSDDTVSGLGEVTETRMATEPILDPPPAFITKELEGMETEDPTTVWDPGTTTTTDRETNPTIADVRTILPPPPDEALNLKRTSNNLHKRKSAGDHVKQQRNPVSENIKGNICESVNTNSENNVFPSGINYKLIQKPTTNMFGHPENVTSNENIGSNCNKENECTRRSVANLEIIRAINAVDSAEYLLDLLDSYQDVVKKEKIESSKRNNHVNAVSEEPMHESPRHVTITNNPSDYFGDEVDRATVLYQETPTTHVFHTSSLRGMEDKYLIKDTENSKMILSKLQNGDITNNQQILKTLETDKSDEMKIMVNSLSPVLLRRRPSQKSTGRKQTDSSSNENSPEMPMKVSYQSDDRDSLRIHSKTDVTAGHKLQVSTEVKHNKQEKRKSKTKSLNKVDRNRYEIRTDGNANNIEPQDAVNSLFMDPKMTRTWHGTTYANLLQIYGPQLRAMSDELNGQDTDSDMFLNNVTDAQFQSKTLPSRSLLDQMHKKFCADQYLDNYNSDIARGRVVLKLKPNSQDNARHFNIPALPKRSQHIKMGTGSTHASASFEGSRILSKSPEWQRRTTSPQSHTLPNYTKKKITLEDIKAGSEAQCTRKEDAEIEAVEACRWLKETGFPQYAQMYEDGQFPVDVDSVENDHDFLDKEDMQSLFRRLNSLNKCAVMKIGTPSKKDSEDSDDEDPCALSDKWKFTRSSRRWSRNDEISTPQIGENGLPVLKPASSHDSLLADQNSSSETGDSPVLDSKMYHLNTGEVFLPKTSTPSDPNGNATTGFSPNVLRRAASERIKGAKSFLKRMESLKGKRSRKQKHIGDIGSPVVSDRADMQAKIQHLNCKDLNSSGLSDTSRILSPSVNSNSSQHPVFSDVSVTSEVTSVDDSRLNALDQSRDSGINQYTDSSNNHSRRSELSKSELNILSLTNGALGALGHSSDGLSITDSLDETLFLPVDYRPKKFPKLLDDSIFTACDNMRTRSFSYVEDSHDQTSNTLRRISHDPRHDPRHRVSIYDNVPIEEDLTVAQQELDIILSELFQNINGLNRAINGADAELLEPPVAGLFDDTSLSLDSQTPENEPNLDTSSDILQEHDENENDVISGTLSSPDISDHELHGDLSPDDSVEHVEYRERRDSGVGSSLTRTSSDRRRYRIRWHSFQKSHRPNSGNRNLQIHSLSAGQISLLRKLSMLKLTALIEKYSPNRSGWALTMPRFMKRHKAPDYRNKNVFGVPFSVMIQRTGQALPQCVLYAMRFLRRNVSEAVGIFRKPGVRSRIQKLRNEIEANPDIVDFEELQAYDVADLVKQYFRELPECLLTNKLSDIFLSIFIYVPPEFRVDALQAAVVLMADENRDVLQSLLLFLWDIAQHASQHQMTASNLAVCFAPSLFNMGGAKNPTQTPSPRRNRKNAGIPDARELMEQKAAHECLTVMIQECKNMFTIPAATLSKCRCWHGDPVTLSELNTRDGEQGGAGYRAHVNDCIQGLLKEARDKFRGWVAVPGGAGAELAYKKVGDGHPLRLWKCAVEVDAPPGDVLHRVLHDRKQWDEDLLSESCVEQLDEHTEVFQYVMGNMPPHPPRDYCVLRSWRTDLPRGAVAIVSTSIAHPHAAAGQGDIHAVELASHYLIEPCGMGRSRLTHISRVDMRGHSLDWYKKVYGHICVNFVKRIRATFGKSADGRETNV